jgi:hypothetical protein
MTVRRQEYRDGMARLGAAVLDQTEESQIDLGRLLVRVAAPPRGRSHSRGAVRYHARRTARLLGNFA